MALQDKLDAIREASKTRIPPEAQAIMRRSIDELRASGIMARVARVGQTAPDFTLPNAAGRAVSLTELPGGRPCRAVVLPWPLVTVLQRRAAAGPAGDHRRRRDPGRHLAAGRAHAARDRGAQAAVVRAVA